MKAKNLSLTALAIVGVSAFAASAFAAAPAAPAAPGAPAAGAPATAAPAVTFENMNPTVKTFADLKTIEGTENICQAADGSLFVTLINVNKLLKVSPDGKTVTEFASVPTAANMLGVGCGNDPEVVAIVFNKTFRGTPAVAATATTPAVPATPNNFNDNDVHAIVYDLAGKQVKDIAVPKGFGINGFDAAGGGIYYGGNSGKPEVVKLDSKTGMVTAWYDAKDYAGPPPVPPAGPPIAINGVRFANGWVYFRGLKPGSSPAIAGLYRIQVGPNGQPMGTPQELFAVMGVGIDDFDVGPDGSAYFPSGTTLYKVTTAGVQTKLAENIVGGPSLVVGKDGKTLYWPTRVGGGQTIQRVLQFTLP
jgi:hypothetical protein